MDSHLIINIEVSIHNHVGGYDGTNYRVHTIGLSPTPLVIPAEGYLNLVGEVAEWLYVALTGHTYDEPPFQPNCSLIRANAARAYIQAKQHTQAAWRIAQEVVEQWGLHIQPWLGCIIQSDDGKIVEDAQEYWSIYCLVTGAEIPSALQYSIWVSER